MKTNFNSPLGQLILISCHGRLVYVNWDERECDQKLVKIENTIQDSLESNNRDHRTCNIEDKDVLEQTVAQLSEYFSGQRKEFELPIKFLGSEFQKSVWQALMMISHGDTITYKELAERCGKPKAYRAVAKACGENPLAIISPCHRVVASGAKIGGYTGGLQKKIALLELESKKIFG